MTLHHTNSTKCPLCEEKLKDTDPRLRSWFRVVKAKFSDTHISCSWRGQADQEIAVRTGKSRAHWPKSKHNHCAPDGAPCSLALDVFQLENGRAMFKPSFYFKLNALTKSQGFPIVWGGTFTRIVDLVHFELGELAEFRARVVTAEVH